MTTAASVISAFSVTGATSWDAPFRATANVGTTVMVGICTVGTGINISTGSVTDTKGNTWSVVAHTSNGANGNDVAILTCRVATQITSSDTLHIPVTGGSFTSVTAQGSAISDDRTVVGTPTVTSVSSGSTVQTSSGTTTNTTQVCWAWNQKFTSATGATASYTDGHFTASTGTPVRSGSNNAAIDGFYAPGAAGTQTATCTWGSGIGNSGNTIVVVLDTAPVNSLSLTGKRGAIASGFSRYGAVTTADATILALTGKKTAQAAAHGRFGQFTNEYLNFGGVAFADARFGDLSSAAALTAITGVKGAHAVGFSRFGALTTNTRGNARLAGTRTAIAFADSRFGLISLIGLDITGLRTASALADARFGSLLLHNRTPGLVTLRAEQVGLVTIRTGV